MKKYSCPLGFFLLPVILLIVTACLAYVATLDTEIVSATVKSAPQPKQSLQAQNVETVPDFIVNCTSTGQLCSPPYAITIETSGLVKVQYSVHAKHCSPIRLDILIDGIKVQRTGFLGWSGAGGQFASLPLDTGLLDLSPVSPGTHTVGLQAEGQTVGCNRGYLAAWGGSLVVITSSTPEPTATPMATPRPTATPSPMPTPVPECGFGEPCVYLYATQTRVPFVNPILLNLSIVNNIAKPPMTAQLIMQVPSGWALRGSGFNEACTGQCSAVYEVQPGGNRSIEITLQPNQAGDFEIKANLDWFFGGDTKTLEGKSLSIPVSVEPLEPPTPSPSPLATPVPTTAPAPAPATSVPPVSSRGEGASVGCNFAPSSAVTTGLPDLMLLVGPLLGLTAWGRLRGSGRPSIPR